MAAYSLALPISGHNMRLCPVKTNDAGFGSCAQGFRSFVQRTAHASTSASFLGIRGIDQAGYCPQLQPQVGFKMGR